MIKNKKNNLNIIFHSLCIIMNENASLLQNEVNVIPFNQNDVENNSINSNDSGENLCWICKEIMTFEEMKTYCSCEGYISYVHYNCLNTWLNTSHRTNCEFCGDEYTYRYKINWKLFLNNSITSKMLFIICSLFLLSYAFVKNNYIYVQYFYQKIINIIIILTILNYTIEYISSIYHLSKMIVLVSI